MKQWYIGFIFGKKEDFAKFVNDHRLTPGEIVLIELIQPVSSDYRAGFSFMYYGDEQY